jgi:Tol biopolymer transport system component
MTAEQRLERHLPAVLEDLYLGPTPDYRDEVMTTAVHRRQRPPWTFPGRWLPMADIASRPAIAPRLPWRTLGVALVLIALLVVAALVYVGSQRTELPPPFGVARNGLIAYALNGDIYAADPVSGTTGVIVGGDAVDRNPIHSRDGSRIAFLRQTANDSRKFDLAVVGRDGGTVTILTTDPIDLPDYVEWSPDGRSIYLGRNADVRLWRYDASRRGGPVLVAEGVHVQPGAFRPPDGAQILFQPDVSDRTALWVMNADGTNPRPLIERPAENVAGSIVGSAAWSPDGTLVAFGVNPLAIGPNQARITVMNADGTGIRQLDNEDGTWIDNDLVWSPDSKQIAFNRWQQVNASTDEWAVRPIGVISIDGGGVRPVGTAPVSEGAAFNYSPDGKAIVALPGPILAPGAVARPALIDVLSGGSRPLAWTVGSGVSWQRLALEP